MQKVIGHAENKERLQRSLTRNRFPSTFLFVGPQGIGKKTFAMELAKCLLCEKSPANQLVCCGQCESCLMVDSRNHPDFMTVEILHNKNQLILEQFIGDREHRNRAGLCYDLSLKPTRGKRKVAIIDDADSLGVESANCLLKTLEEPPPFSVLIMVGSNADQLLPTIRSRSQVFHFGRLTDEELTEILKEQEFSDLTTSRERVVEECQGSLQRIFLFREEGLLEFRSVFYAALATHEPMSHGFPRELSGFVDQAGKEPPKRRKRLRMLTEFGLEFYRLIFQQLSGIPIEVPDSLKQLVQKAVDNWKSDAEAATDCVERCLDTQRQIDANANQTTLIESWLSDLGKLARGEEIYATHRISDMY